MHWRDLLGHLDVIASGGGDGAILHQVTRDLSEAGPGVLMVAVQGAKFDTHQGVPRLPPGSSVLLERHIDGIGDGVAWAVVRDARRSLGTASAKVWGDPAREIPVVGITGTNGKTTVAWWLAEAAARLSSRPSAYLGTLGVRVGDRRRASRLTTPEAPLIHRTLRDLADAQGTIAAMEVSSVALSMGRVEGLPFHTAVFTQLGRDHLDFHGTMDAYRDAKARLFQSDQLRAVGGAPRAILCGDDPSWTGMGPPADRWLYGFEASSDVRIVEWSPSAQGSVLRIDGAAGQARIITKAIGRFNALNLTAAWAAGVTAGLDGADLASALSQTPLPPGRFSRVPDPAGRVLLVDYAHTPEALAAALRAVREITLGRVHVVFGCGGDRDPGKRPQMGAAACAGADVVWVTSDNPRTEDPAAIAAQVVEGAGAQARVILDRAEAIRAAVQGASPGDVVLVAGKGHETEQWVGSGSIPFDDMQALAKSVEESS